MLDTAQGEPRVESVHVLLKQVRHANDRALILNCLYNQDDKVLP